MAASKTNHARTNYRFLPTSHQTMPNKPSPILELDESEVWNSEPRSASPELKKAAPTSSRKSSSERVGGPASLPVKVPDWSKILKEEYRENRGRDEEYEENGNRIPPHEFLVRQTARTRPVASFSVHEGIGRTLKGRDLSTVRNAVWEKIGFQD